MIHRQVMARVNVLLSILVIASMLVTPSMATVAQELVPPASPETPANPVDETTEPTEPVDETTEPTDPVDETTEPTDPVGETTEPTDPADETTEPADPVDETTEPTDQVDGTTDPGEEEAPVSDPADSTDVNANDAAPQSDESKMAPAQTAETGNITFAMSSADPGVANRIADNASWSVSTRSNGAERYFVSVANNRIMPVDFTSTWLNNIPYGEATITINAGPEFEIWQKIVDVNAPTLRLDVVLIPKTEIDSGIFYFNVVSQDSSVLNRVPAGTSFRVYNEGGELVFSRAGIPQALPTVVQAPAYTSAALPLGDYRVIVTPPADSGFLPFDATFTLSQASQNETVTLKLDVPASTFTGSVQVNHISLANTVSPLAGATVTLENGTSAVTPANGLVSFENLETGSYPFTVVASDARTATGTLTISDADGSATVELDKVNAEMTVTISACPELPSTLVAGDKVAIEFTITNTGNVRLTNARGRIFKLSNRTTYYAPVETLQAYEPGDSLTVTVNYTLDQSEIDAGNLRANASVQATRPIGQATTWSTSLNDCLIDQAPATYSGTVQVVEAGGTGVADAAVTVNETTIDTDGSGNAAFADLEDGEYPVSVLAADGRTASGILSISGADGSVTITLPAIVTKLTLGEVCPDLSGEIRIGDVVTFEFTVTNDSNVNITGLRGSVYQNETGKLNLSDPAIPTTLAPGESATVIVKYTIGARDTNAGGIDGTAQVAGKRPNGTSIVSSKRTLPCTFVPYENFEISAAAICPEDLENITIGDEITTTLVITNTGETLLQTPIVTTNREERVAKVLTIGLDGSRTVTYVTKVTEADLEAGSITVDFSVKPGRVKGEPITREVSVNCNLTQTDETHSMTISAVEEDGTTPVVGAVITVVSDDDAEARVGVMGTVANGVTMPLMQIAPAITTNENGIAVIDGLADGTYTVTGVATDGRTASATVVVSGGDATGTLMFQTEDETPVTPPVTPDPTETPAPSETPAPTEEPTETPDPSETPAPTQPAVSPTAEAGGDSGSENSSAVTGLPETGTGSEGPSAFLMAAVSIVLAGMTAIVLRVRSGQRS